MRTEEMLRTHPGKPVLDLTDTASCITSCIECADACSICADACLGEEKVTMLVKCIRNNLDCADICGVTARVLARQTHAEQQLMVIQLEACATVCGMCAAECERHAGMHGHCKICALACRNCEQMCRQLLRELSGRSGRTGMAAA